MSQPSEDSVTCNIVTKPALHYVEARVPLRIVEKVNAYIDAVRDTADDYSGFLVGQIRRNARSAQLQLDLNDEIPAALAEIIVQVGTQLVNYHGFEGRVSANDMWTIHSYEGDYNPLHDHGVQTNFGLSSFIYLKVPPQIAALPPVESGGAPRLNMATGNCDGFTQLLWGAHGMKDLSILRPPTQQYIKPEVGKLLVFPNWLLHRVEPFFGEGERRTLSCNMNVELFD